jgi:hypothetical protein
MSVDVDVDIDVDVRPNRHRRDRLILRVVRTLIVPVVILLVASGAAASDGGARFALEPGWLPARFAPDPQPIADGRTGIAYPTRNGDKLLLTASAPDACAQIRSQEAITVHGQPGTLIVRGCAPWVEARWSEAGQTYALYGESASGGPVLSLDELRRIAESMRPARPLPNAASTNQVVDVVTGQFELKVVLLLAVAFALLLLERARFRQLASARR